MTRVPTSRNDSAVSRTRTTSSADTSLIDSKCLFIVPLPSPACGASSRSIVHVHGVFAVHLLQRDANRLVLPGRYVLAYEVGPDRQFPVPSIHQYGERHRGRPAEVDQRVHRGADGPAGEQDVVDQHDRLAGDVEADPG